MTSDGTAGIQTFVILAKGKKGKGLCAVIEQACASPSVFSFGPLMALQNVKELADGEFAPYFRLLQLFAFGTLQGLDANSVPTLNNQHLHKLRLLSLARLCGGPDREISYEAIEQATQVKNTRELEDLVIEAIYADLVAGSLDQHRRLLLVERARPKDVQAADVPQLINILSTWEQQAGSVMSNIQTQLDHIQVVEKERQAAQKSHLQQVEKVAERVASDSSHKREDEAMAVAMASSLNDQHKRNRNAIESASRRRKK